jgi:hypothetical protein
MSTKLLGVWASCLVTFSHFLQDALPVFCICFVFHSVENIVAESVFGSVFFTSPQEALIISCFLSKLSVILSLYGFLSDAQETRHVVL